MTSYYNKDEHRTMFWRIALNQRLYYISSLLTNAALLSFYTVMSFTHHVPCLDDIGMNITRGFEFAFRLGFAMTVADIINSSFVEFYIRQRHYHDLVKNGNLSNVTASLETLQSHLEWYFRFLTCFVSLLQTIIRSSKSAKECVNKSETLKVENMWLKWLVVAQLVKVCIFAVWHYHLNRRKFSYFANQFDATFFDQTTLQTSMDFTRGNAALNRTNMTQSRYLQQQ